MEPAAPVAVATGYTMPPPADPALMERNRKLSAQMQRGERWLIGGRVGAPLSLVPTLIGAVLLGTYSARSRAEAYSRSGAYESLSPPPNRAMLMGGIAFTVVGVGGLATSIYAAVHGFRLMQSARAGQFAFDAGPRHAALTFRARF